MSLRTKTSLLLASLLIVILGLAGYNCVRLLENSLRNSIYSGLESLSAAQSQAISRFLEDALEDVQTVASFLPQQAIEEKNIAIIEKHLEKALKNYPKFQNGIFLLDARGTLWADYPVHPEARGKNFAFREYFKTTMEKEKGIIGVPYRSARTGEAVLTFTAFLRGSSNQNLGLLGSSVQLLHPDALGGIWKTKIGKHGYIFIFDTSRLMILHPEEQRILVRDIPHGANRLIDEAIEGFEGVGETVDSRGVPILLALRQIPGTNWIVGVQQPKSEAFGSIKTVRNRILMGIVAALIISIPLGLLAVRRLTGPLDSLRGIALEIGNQPLATAREDLKGRLKSLSSSDEIGTLAKAFEEMADRLDQTILSLKTALRDWERTFDSVQDPIFLLDRENKILRINHSASELIGLSPEKAIGQPCFKFIHGTEEPPPSCPHQQTLKSQRPTTLEVEEPRLKGFFEVTTTPVMDEEEMVVGTIHVMRDITQRKQAEAILRESEERYRTLVENVRDSIFTLSADGTITSLNSAFETITGYPRQEWIGKSFGPLIHPEDLGKASEILREILEGRTLPPFELRFLRNTGDYHTGEFTVTRLLQGETIQGVLGVARDIEQRKQTEETLRLSEEKFSKIYKTSPAWIAISTIEEGRFIEANDAFWRDLGYNREEFIGYTSLELGLWANPEERSHWIAELREKGYVRNREATFKKKSGELIHILISSELIQIGGKDYILSVCLDITERKRAEESLKNSEERYRTLVESTSDAILVLDPERRIVSCNQACCHLFGYEREELEGRSIRILHSSEESFKSFGELAYPIVFREGSFRGEWDLIDRDGKTISVETSLSTIRSSDGSITGYVNILRDLSERKKAEQEKVDLQEQLLQSQKMEAIGTLAGGVAHDFNNLLTIIQGNSELTLMRLKEGDLKKNIEEIKQAAQRGADLTRQLLAFSRRQILEPKVLDLNTHIKNLEKMLRRILGEDIQLRTFLSEETGRIKADPGQIDQVILNLIVNARDAMPRGGKLVVETSNVELTEEYARRHVGVTPGPYVLLSISDTGVGMTHDIKERIFEPFFTTKAKGKGTGLGLSTVYGIVKQTGGNIWVYSEPGKGTTFKIYLPRVDLPLDQLREKSSVELPRGSETILVIEDEGHVREITLKMLTRLGYQVLEASEGAEAIRIGQERREPIHLILTDVVMPGMSGKQLVEELQRDHSEAKVLFMSGYTDNAIAHYGILDEGINYLPKPFSFEDLARKVREVLDQ